MTTRSFEIIGRGAYSLAEAERITRIPRQRLRRWLEGYDFVSKGTRHRSTAIVKPAIGRGAGVLTLSFADLLEVQFLNAFLGFGVSWRSVRIAAQRAQEIVGSSHPFSTKSFKTDGRDILADIIDAATGAADLLNLVRDQWEISRVVNPMLVAGIEYQDSIDPSRWWPLGRRKHVVIDPARSFGAPIVDEGGVRTQVLASAVKAEGAAHRVAAIYGVPLASVRAAVKYEASLGA